MNRRTYSTIAAIGVALISAITIACWPSPEESVIVGSDKSIAVDNLDFETVEQPASVLVIQLSGIKQTTGTIKVAVFANGEGYPDQKQAAHLQSFAVGQVIESVTLMPVPPGRYAIAIYHDVNDDGKMNRAKLGYPIEPYGFSNSARATFGPPSYSLAEFEAISGKQYLSIELR